MNEPQPPGFVYGMYVRVKSDAPIVLRPGAIGAAVSLETVTTADSSEIGWPVSTLLYRVEYLDGEQELVPATMTVREPQASA
jgi:hypothetical protein